MFFYNVFTLDNNLSSMWYVLRKCVHILFFTASSSSLEWDFVVKKSQVISCALRIQWTRLLFEVNLAASLVRVGHTLIEICR